MPSYFPPHISRPGPGYVGSRQSLPRQSDRGELEQKVPFIDFCHFPERHSITKSRSTSINQFTIHSLSIRILCQCPSLSCLFHCCSYVKDSFLPIGTLLAKGTPPASEFGTSSEVDALEPSKGILSGSSDRVSEAIGLTREGL